MSVPWGEIAKMTELDRRIRAVFFDLDETLLDDDGGMRESVTGVCGTMSQRYPVIDAQELEATYLGISDEVWRSLGVVPRAAGSGDSNGREIRVEVWGKALASHGLPGRPLAVEALPSPKHRSDDVSRFPLHVRQDVGV